MKRGTLVVMILVPLAVLYASLFIGRFHVPVADVARILASRFLPIVPNWPAAMDTIVVQIRLPRAILAMFVGAGLSVSGAAFQGMFRNPLVSPDILGVTAASGFGAALALLWSCGAFGSNLIAFLFGIGGCGVDLSLARTYRSTPMLDAGLVRGHRRGFFQRPAERRKVRGGPGLEIAGHHLLAARQSQRYLHAESWVWRCPRSSWEVRD